MKKITKVEMKKITVEIKEDIYKEWIEAEGFDDAAVKESLEQTIKTRYVEVMSQKRAQEERIKLTKELGLS